MLSKTLAVVAFAAATPLFAMNVSFIEGDAFFHSVLVEGWFDEHPADDGSVVFEYVDPTPRMASGCGNAGYTALRVVGDVDPTVDILRRLYAELRRAYPKKVLVGAEGSPDIELNGFHLFVYNRGVDFTGRDVRLAIKYNEDWADQTDRSYRQLVGDPTYGKPRPDLSKYDAFVDSTEAVVHDWRMGPLVAPLQARASELGTSSTEVTADVANVQIVLVPKRRLTPYFKRRPGRNFYAIQGDRVVVYRFVENETESKVLREDLSLVRAIEWLDNDSSLADLETEGD